MDNKTLFGFYASLASIFQQQFQAMMNACGDDEARKQQVDVAFLTSQIEATKAGVVLLQKNQPVLDQLATDFAAQAQQAENLLNAVSADAASINAIASAVQKGKSLLENPQGALAGALGGGPN